MVFLFIGVGKKFGKDECLKLLLRMSGVITTSFSYLLFSVSDGERCHMIVSSQTLHTELLDVVLSTPVCL